jgi:hypothetical protein
MNNGRREADLILTKVQEAKADPAWDTLGVEEQEAIDIARAQLVALRENGDSVTIGKAIQSLDSATRRLAELMMDAAVTRAIRAGQ